MDFKLCFNVKKPGDPDGRTGWHSCRTMVSINRDERVHIHIVNLKKTELYYILSGDWLCTGD